MPRFPSLLVIGHRLLQRPCGQRGAVYVLRRQAIKGNDHVCRFDSGRFFQIFALRHLSHQAATGHCWSAAIGHKGRNLDPRILDPQKHLHRITARATYACVPVGIEHDPHVLRLASLLENPGREQGLFALEDRLLQCCHPSIKIAHFSPLSHAILGQRLTLRGLARPVAMTQVMVTDMR
jgi:hypothetical protein